MKKASALSTKSVNTRIETGEAYEHYSQNVVGLEPDDPVCKALNVHGFQSLLDLLMMNINDCMSLDFVDDKGNIQPLNHSHQGLVCAMNAYIRYLVRDKGIKDIISITQNDFNMYCNDIYNAPDEFDDLTLVDFYTDTYNYDDLPTPPSIESKEPSDTSPNIIDKYNDYDLHMKPSTQFHECTTYSSDACTFSDTNANTIIHEIHPTSRADESPPSSNSCSSMIQVELPLVKYTVIDLEEQTSLPTHKDKNTFNSIGIDDGLLLLNTEPTPMNISDPKNLFHASDHQRIESTTHHEEIPSRS